MLPEVAGFDWDDGNRGKCQNHGVSVAVIEGLFQWPIAVFPDPEHSSREERFKAIGRAENGRYVLVVFTLRSVRDDTLIRPISARYMHAKESEYYEKEIARAAQRRGS